MKYVAILDSDDELPEDVKEDFWERAGYDRALRDCGVLEE